MMEVVPPSMVDDDDPLMMDDDDDLRQSAATTTTPTSSSFVLNHNHRRFASVEEYVSELGGSKAHVISKVLIANNGVAAVKAIRSIRRWAYDVFGDEKTITFVVMATPEDLRANAEYIRMGDVIVDVPGGSNNHNYANVTLIVELARLHGVHAVWAGWGHASENPTLPDLLQQSKPRIQFIGPAGPPMRALGDKIGSTIIAQSAGVPCIAWNGSDIRAEYDVNVGALPTAVYEQATVATASQATQCAQDIGFPVMIKASEGGGGKGIRRVEAVEHVADAYRQVCGEVPGSPIFIMKLSQQARHLEVQLLADEYGQAIALNGRDCSVQRRHQKIIEEGPPVAALPHVWQDMERAAVALAKAVHYANAGTVEYLYSEAEAKFYFLELNPRLQVEHPVTEMITQVNLPAAQLQVAMGLPLHHIPEIRELYGYDRFFVKKNSGGGDGNDDSTIDFDTAKRREPTGHCLAVRITAENAEAGFQPTSGGLAELNFRSTPNVWGYFSMDSSGRIHEFADSQFGHLFATGPDREHARRNMVLALKELSIRGDISTTVDYISKLIELPDYIDNQIDTAWLDGIIRQNQHGMGGGSASGGGGGGESGTTVPTLLRRRSSVHQSSDDDGTGANVDHVHVVVGATILAMDHVRDAEQEFLDLLQKGQLPNRSLLQMTVPIELILHSIKYKLECTCNGVGKFGIRLGGSGGDGGSDKKTVSTSVRVLSDGGYLIAMGGQSYVAYVTSRGGPGGGLRLSMGGATVVFSADYDPTSLRSEVAGKLVKQLLTDGAHVKKGQPYAEMEVMKMFLPLKVEEAGTLTWLVNEGAALQAGDLIARVTLDNPENVASVEVFEDDLNVSDGTADPETEDAPKQQDKQPLSPSPLPRAHLQFRSALQVLQQCMAGYLPSNADSVDQAWKTLECAVTTPLLPVLEIQEQLSVLNGRIPSPLFNGISNRLAEFQQVYEETAQKTTEEAAKLKFPGEEILAILDGSYKATEDATERQGLQSITEQLRKTILPYAKASSLSVPGAERACQCVEELLRQWIAVERWFGSGGSGSAAPAFSDTVETLRQAHKTELKQVLDICRAHEQLSTTSAIVERILQAVGEALRPDTEAGSSSASGGSVSLVAGAASLPSILPVISEIGSMGTSGGAYARVALRARKLLLQSSLPSLDRRRTKVWQAAKELAASTQQALPEDVDELLADRFPIADVLFSLLQPSPKQQDDADPKSLPGVLVGLLELYLRHLYRPYTIKEFERDVEQQMVKFCFLNKPAEGVFHRSLSVASTSELTRAVSSGSLTKNSDSDPDLKAKQVATRSDGLGALLNERGVPPSVERTGLCVRLDSIDALDEAKMKVVLSKLASDGDSASPVNVVYFIVVGMQVQSDQEDGVASQCGTALAPFAQQLLAAAVRRVSFVLEHTRDTTEMGTMAEDSTPVLFTFRAPDFAEDVLYRHIDPSLASHLELDRLAANFSLKSLGSRHSSACHVHLYECRPKPAALQADKWAKKDARIFCRALSFEMDFSSSSFERILVDALNALDLLSYDSMDGDNHHLFLSLVSDFERNVLDPVEVEQIVAAVMKRHAHRLTGLGLAEVETRIVCCLTADSPPIAIRLFCSNPTGFVQVMNTYVEASGSDAAADSSAAASATDRVYKLVGGTKASLAGTGDSSWDGLNVKTPYPLTRPFDAQRKAALKSSDTVYCYDLPALLEAAVEQQWQQHQQRATSAAVSLSQQGAAAAQQRPLMVMYTTELVVQKKDAPAGSKWTAADFEAGKLELVQENRGAGHNDVGMVAWLVTLRTVEYPNGRQVVLIANDITVKAGSFGTREDVVFKMASDLAREKRIPRLFIAANSGARIGLADGVKKAYQVAFKNAAKPESGFDYLYLEPAFYETFSKDFPQVRCEPITYQGRKVYRITDIIGKEPDLGVENLKGSGLIAGETAHAYRHIFTLTVVLGRTVGIGAYLVRLGHRTIQKTSAAPIILTGYQALNKLMGVNVYSTNEQIGGPGIMHLNGISHQTAQDHLQCIRQAVDWLSYVPSQRGGLLPVTDIRGIDDVERPIEFVPQAGVPYDPRMLIAGHVDPDTDHWIGGFFDKDSWTESLAGWAKTVVVGRARLGGIPMGVICTENRTVTSVRPADPADLKAAESELQEAGCVWFPNSAYKTAQSILDFKTEDLPLIVFANWRGFSGGQRDMFDEVLKYGSMIVDAFVQYQQPVFIFIPPHGEIRGGAWVVLDGSINSACMEMYAAKGTARGGVLEANGAASVKYRTRDLIATMHRLDGTLQDLDKQLAAAEKEEEKQAIAAKIAHREKELLPVYEQISVQFCELHDTPGRMKAVGVIRQEVDWATSRSYFYWRLRRKLAEFDLRRQLVQATKLGRATATLTAQKASEMICDWFLATGGGSLRTKEQWDNDKAVLQWMAEHHAQLEQRILQFSKQVVAQEVERTITAGGSTAQVGLAGIVEGLSRGMEKLSPEEKRRMRDAVLQAFQ